MRIIYFFRFSMCRAYGIFFISVVYKFHVGLKPPANTRLRPNAVLMLTHRLRRWASIRTALGQRFVLSLLLRWWLRDVGYIISLML